MPKTSLQPREKRVLVIGAVVTVIFGLYLGGRAPLKKYRESVSSVQAARKDIKTIHSFHQGLLAARSDQKALTDLVAARGKRFNLTNALNGLSQSQFKGRVTIDSKASSPYGTSFVSGEITFTGVSLKELVDFLHQVYSSKNLIIVTLNELSVDAKGKGLTCRLGFDTPKG